MEHITSAHVLLARTSHMSLNNLKERENGSCNLTVCLKGRGPEYLWISPMTITAWGLMIPTTIQSPLAYRELQVQGQYQQLPSSFWFRIKISEYIFYSLLTSPLNYSLSRWVILSALRKQQKGTDLCKTSHILIKFLCHPKVWCWMLICTFKKIKTEA